MFDGIDKEGLLEVGPTVTDPGKVVRSVLKSAGAFDPSDLEVRVEGLTASTPDVKRKYERFTDVDDGDDDLRTSFEKADVPQIDPFVLRKR